MSETPFHSTRMGQRYYEATMPALVREVARLNDNIERMLALAETEANAATGTATGEGEPGERP